MSTQTDPLDTLKGTLKSAIANIQDCIHKQEAIIDEVASALQKKALNPGTVEPAGPATTPQRQAELTSRLDNRERIAEFRHRILHHLGSLSDCVSTKSEEFLQEA